MTREFRFDKVARDKVNKTRGNPPPIPMAKGSDYGELQMRVALKNLKFFDQNERAIDPRISLDLLANMPGTPYDGYIYRTAFFMKPDYQFDENKEPINDSEGHQLTVKNADGSDRYDSFVVKAMSLLRAAGEDEDREQFGTMEEFLERLEALKVPYRSEKPVLFMAQLKAWKKPEVRDSHDDKIILVPAVQLYQLGYVSKLKSDGFGKTEKNLFDKEQAKPVTRAADHRRDQGYGRRV